MLTVEWGRSRLQNFTRGSSRSQDPREGAVPRQSSATSSSPGRAGMLGLNACSLFSKSKRRKKCWESKGQKSKAGRAVGKSFLMVGGKAAKGFRSHWDTFISLPLLLSFRESFSSLSFSLVVLAPSLLKEQHKPHCTEKQSGKCLRIPRFLPFIPFHSSMMWACSYHALGRTRRC